MLAANAAGGEGGKSPETVRIAYAAYAMPLQHDNDTSTLLKVIELNCDTNMFANVCACQVHDYAARQPVLPNPIASLCWERLQYDSMALCSSSALHACTQ